MEAKMQQQAPQQDQVNKPNLTGIPTQMKLDFERQSGLSFDDVRVHYNSDKPAQLQALAYTQGTQVYVGPGQERHLPHELGHVVQQKSGIVHPTHYIRGVPINNQPRLEYEANQLPIQRMVTRNTIETIQLFPGSKKASGYKGKTVQKPQKNTSHRKKSMTKTLDTFLHSPKIQKEIKAQIQQREKQKTSPKKYVRKQKLNHTIVPSPFVFAENRVFTFFSYQVPPRGQTTVKPHNVVTTNQGPHTVAHKYISLLMQNKPWSEICNYLIIPYPFIRIQSIFACEFNIKPNEQELAANIPNYTKYKNDYIEKYKCVTDPNNLNIFGKVSSQTVGNVVSMLIIEDLSSYLSTILCSFFNQYHPSFLLHHSDLTDKDRIFTFLNTELPGIMKEFIPQYLYQFFGTYRDKVKTDPDNYFGIQVFNEYKLSIINKWLNSFASLKGIQPLQINSIDDFQKYIPNFGTRINEIFSDAWNRIEIFGSNMIGLIEMHPYASYGWNRGPEKLIAPNEKYGKAESNINLDVEQSIFDLALDPFAEFHGGNEYVDFLKSRLYFTSFSKTAEELQETRKKLIEQHYDVFVEALVNSISIFPKIMANVLSLDFTNEDNMKNINEQIGKLPYQYSQYGLDALSNILYFLQIYKDILPPHKSLNDLKAYESMRKHLW